MKYLCISKASLFHFLEIGKVYLVEVHDGELSWISIKDPLIPERAMSSSGELNTLLRVFKAQHE